MCRSLVFFTSKSHSAIRKPNVHIESTVDGLLISGYDGPTKLPPIHLTMEQTTQLAHLIIDTLGDS